MLKSHLLRHYAPTSCHIDARKPIRSLVRAITCISTLLIILALIQPPCNHYFGTSHVLVQAQRFVDTSNLKPSIVLIVPQSLKVPTNPLQADAVDQSTHLQQYVALINNAQNDREDQLLREQYPKLSLQVRDARSPITGQLFYEHVFDYFSQNQQYLLIPINLDQVSGVQERSIPAKSSTTAQNAFTPPGYSNLATTIVTDFEQTNDQLTTTTTTSQSQQLIVSIRPHKLDNGFGSDNIELVSSIPIVVESVPSKDGRRSFAIVQTDKPIYKPDEKVRIRGLVVNELMRPILRDELRLQIRNPQKIVVEEIRFPRSTTSDKTTPGNVNLEPLYLDHTFEFPPFPMLGLWSAHLLHNDPIANDTISFEVKEYVLPPFEIEFHSPQQVLPNTQLITGHLFAKYHFGKPVQGIAQLKFGIRESLSTRPKFIARSTARKIDPITGKVEYKINSTKIKETSWFPGIAGSRFVIEATIIDMTTGHRETAQDFKCKFISMPFRISFEDSIEDFKPGLGQQLIVQLTESQSHAPGPAGELLVAQYRDQNGTLLGVRASASLNQPADFHEQLDTEALTDSLGRATFNIGPIREAVTSIQVSVKLFNSTSNLKQQQTKESGDSDLQLNSNALAIGHHVLVKHESQNGWISLMNKSLTNLNVGDEFVSDLLIRDAVVIPQKIFFIILARGQIISLDALNSDGLVSFKITETMMPSIRLVLFALTHDSIGLLSDSMRINIGQDLDCGLRLEYQSKMAGRQTNNANVAAATTIRPNDKGQLNIRARQGDLVSLIGVDSAVYTLNNRTQLDSSRIIQRVRRLDSGCGFSGGRNNLDVLHNAGLMLFKDAASSGPSESPSSYIGSSCLTIINQLKYLEDVQMGYTKPMFAHLNRPYAFEMLALKHQRQRSALSAFEIHHSRTKREVNVEAILQRYKDPFHRSCCRLGTFEDLPQRRNCDVRAKIVERYMGQDDTKHCAQVYVKCCQSVFESEEVNLSSMITGRAGLEPTVLSRKISPSQAIYHNEPVLEVPTVGQLDKVEADTLIRRDFRETWLFDLVEIKNSNGIAQHQVQLPHSITSWTISAMALNIYKPMCLMSKPIKLTTFQQIFLQVSMPYKVVEGEQIDLVTSVFNYSPQNADVLVYMHGIDDVCSEAEPGERSELKRIRVGNFSSEAVLFPMIPLKIGKYNIKLVAKSMRTNHSDIVERQLNVVARGKPVTDETTFSLDPMNQQRRSKRAIQTGNLVDEIDSVRGLQRSKVRLAPTRDSGYIVPQTQECFISAIGDQMGQTVQTTMLDVENLIRLPHGCGEQVMIYLGPTLYTARYLSSMNKLTGDTRWRAIRYIQSGYKRILNFRKESTGAFSAFARRDPSIWLTAFVAKMLCQTERTPFISNQVHVDKTVISSALNWLVGVQNQNTGTWIELNPVYHREIMGGILHENALTAFVTLTLNECAHHSLEMIDESNTTPQSNSSSLPHNDHHQQTNGLDQLKLATLKAQESLMLDRYKAVKERNPYVLALSAYALSFSRPREAALILNDLLLFAERSQSRNHLFWRGDYPIETAAYALQAVIELAPVLSPNDHSSDNHVKNQWLPGADALAIANWLSSRRSYTGAFESTQDTVVALEALSKFAQLQSSPSGHALLPQQFNNNSPTLMCNVTISNRTRRSIEFGKNNAQILQTFKLDSFEFDNSIDSEMLDIITSGNGLGTMSVKLKYNVFQEEDELCRFNIDTSIVEWQPPQLPIQTSNSILEQLSQQSDGIIDLKAPTSLNDSHGPTNETATEEDIFKTFDKLMLGELNLINQPSEHQQRQQPARSGKDTNLTVSVLRIRRATASESASNETSWTSRVVSSLRARLPSWMTPKPQLMTPPTAPAPQSIVMSTTTTSAQPPPQTNRLAIGSTVSFPISNRDRQEGTTPTRLLASDSPRSRGGSSLRRSAHSSAAPIGSGGARSSSANQLIGSSSTLKMNPLSKQIEFTIGQNGTTIGANGSGGGLSSSNGIGGSQQVVITNPARQLILLLNICVHHMSARRDSEMSVIEVGIISGFKPNEADLREIINEAGTPAWKYELSADRSLLIIYMHYIPYSGPFCVRFRLIREHHVYNIQSGYIRVYEYYSPTHSCSNFYTPTRITELVETNCDPESHVCKCATKSLCPNHKKLLDLSDINQVNVTSARQQLVDLVCSDRFDLISLVRLKSVRHIEAGKMFRLSLKIKSDLKGNLTKLIEAQRHQKSQSIHTARKPQHLATTNLMDNSNLTISSGVDVAGDATATAPTSPALAMDSTADGSEESTLDYLSLSVDSSCINDDPLLLHLKHPNQWRQGGDLMILFGRYDKIESRQFRVVSTSPKSSSTTNTQPQMARGSKPKAAVLFRQQPSQIDGPTFDDTQQLQYSLTMPLDKGAMLHHISYQADVGQREALKNLILWLELRSRREKWTCPAGQQQQQQLASSRLV